MLEVPELTSGNPQLQKAMNNLVKAENKGLSKLDEKKGLEENKLKLVKDFKSKAGEAKDATEPFKNAEGFRELVGSSSNPEILDVSGIDKSLAKIGSYDIELVQMAQANSISTYGFPDKDKTEVGIGYISFETAEGDSREVYIDRDNNTLEGVARAINMAKVGVRAMAVNDGSDADEPWRLIITSEKTGWKNDIVWPEFNLLDGDVDLDIDRTREAQSAIIKFNGEPLMVDENKVKELLPGVTFDLKKATPGTVVKLEVKPDYQKIEGKAKTMVEKINSVLSFIQGQNQLNANTAHDPSKALGGDVVLHTVESQLRRIIQRTAGDLTESQIQQLNDVGIQFNRSGTLEYDGKKFLQKLESNFDDVVGFFVGNGVLAGFGADVTKVFDGVVRRGDGLATIKEKGIEDRLKRLNDQHDQAEERAKQRIERTKVQLAKVESSIQQMQTMQQGGGVASLLPPAG